jgi:sodium transport system permease protein
LSSFGFLPAQWLLRSDALAAQFQFGWREALTFSPCCAAGGALAALLMAVAIRTKSFKEAQASATVVVLAVSLLPLVTACQPAARSPGTCGCRRWRRTR